MGTTPGSPGESAALKQPFREPSLEIAPHEIVGRRFLGEHLSSQRSEQPEGESGLLRDEPREWLSIEDPDPGILETQHRGRSSRLGQDPELAEEPTGANTVFSCAAVSGDDVDTSRRPSRSTYTSSDGSPCIVT
jgi:hypothetical protein